MARPRRIELSGGFFNVMSRAAVLDDEPGGEECGGRPIGTARLQDLTALRLWSRRGRLVAHLTLGFAGEKSWIGIADGYLRQWQRACNADAARSQDQTLRRENIQCL